MKTNYGGWFEIPVDDMDRAVKFYETVFSFKMERHTMGPLDMAWFPYDHEAPGAAGTLVCNKEFYKPAENGTLIYLSCEDLATELSRVEGAGGKVLVEKKMIAPDYGFMGLFIDSEGNRVALHSAK